MFDFLTRKSHRRSDIRQKRPDTFDKTLRGMRAGGGLPSVGVATAFCILAFCILLLRENVIPYRPGQRVMHDLFSRVDFAYQDDAQLQDAKRRARDAEPRVYSSAGDVLGEIEQYLVDLPDKVANTKLHELPRDLQDIFDEPTLAKVQEYQLKPARDTWRDRYVKPYIRELRNRELIVLPSAERNDDVNRQVKVDLLSIDEQGKPVISTTIRGVQTTYIPGSEELASRLLEPAQKFFPLPLQPKIVSLTLAHYRPTAALDDVATAAAKNEAENKVSPTAGLVQKRADMKIAAKGEITPEVWRVLVAENVAYQRQLVGEPLSGAGGDSWGAAWGQRAGLFGTVVVLTMILAGYVYRYQPRVVRNHFRAIAIAAMLLAMLLTAQLAGMGSSPMYVFGLAPTILVAMILAIAYDQRFAVGVAFIHAAFVTLALGAGLSFMLILSAGVVTCCFMLDDVRTRSKLIEVGGMTALAMIVATGAAGLLAFDPIVYIARNCLYAGAAGLGMGFVVLGILPFIEKAFRITTSMTLLELADMSNPLLRRLNTEAPGTYNHSLQVAVLAEDAAETIGVNSLLCRVAAYYHDIGKINKADYFIENQVDGQNRHLHLSPSVSLLVIIGHVKDGIELAKEYNLPTSVMPFIQQHHGTTLVEFFYHRACTRQEQADPAHPEVSDTEFRYPGPKPRSKEVAIVMLADAVESATRAMGEPNANRIETLVHDLSQKRLLDGQFDDCDLTMRELAAIERSLIKALLGIYHGRIAYPTVTKQKASTGRHVDSIEQVTPAPPTTAAG